MAKQRIAILLGPVHPLESVSVEGHVFGGWAAHLSVDGDRSWHVTYVSSGMNLGNYYGELTEEEAAGIAEALSRRVPSIVVTDYSIDHETRYLLAATVGEYLGEGSVL